MKNFDVVIIGGGLGGLSAALRLSNEGKKVAVLEKHHMIGGYATNFSRKDKDGNVYVFDTALHGIGGLRSDNGLNHHLNELGILKNITWLEKKETATLLNKDGSELDVPSNFNNYQQHLINRYPVEEDNIKQLFSFLMDVKEDMLEVARSHGRMPKHQIYLQGISLYDFLKTYTNNDSLIEEFSFLWLYYGLPPKKLNALYYVLPWVSYHIGGTYYIQGGGGKLSDTFKEMIEATGSKVYLSSEVVEVQAHKNEITAVKTKKGNLFKATNYIIACDPNHIFSLLNNETDEVLAYKTKINSLETGVSLTQLYIGLDCPSSQLGMTKGDYFIEVTSHEQSYEAIQRGDYDKMSFGITCYDNLDSNLNPNNQAVIAIVIGDKIQNWPVYKSEAYKIKKLEVTKKLIDKAEDIFPGLKQHIKVVELGTPHTMKRYTNNSEGAVYGFSQSITQGGFNRLSFNTPLKNTLLAGAWSNPGGGFEGAIISGIMCAQRMLQCNDSTHNQTVHSHPPIPLKIFMIGMLANLDKKKAKNVNDVFHFNFNEIDNFYLQIKNGRGKFLKEKPKEISVCIKTSYQTWYDIAFLGKSGESALFDGELQVEGSVETFMKIPELFNTQLIVDDEVKQSKKVSSLIWTNLALVPWIFYWILGGHITPSSLTLLNTSYILCFIKFIKPQGYKEITSLEALALILFTVNNSVSIVIPQLYDAISVYLIDGALIILLVMSVIVKKPITADYAKLEYSSTMVKTKLFMNINLFLTTIWAIVFTLKFASELLLPAPLENISYLFIVIGLIISYLYPKKKLSL